MKYPWHKAPWRQIMACETQKKLPHALQWVGVPGLGKKEFALAFIRFLLCQQKTSVRSPDREACGSCHSCQLMQASTHPDLKIIEPEEENKAIKVDQIREVIHFVSETALQGVYRVVLFPQASLMNSAAANALLKTLEEPPRNTLIVLITEGVSSLPPTVTSRCQKMIFSKPEKGVALEWLIAQTQKNPEELNILLAVAGGAPLRVKQWLDEGVFLLRETFYKALTQLSDGSGDPLAMAVEYQDKPVDVLFYFLSLWVQDALRFSLSEGKASLMNEDFRAVFLALSKRMLHETLFDYVAILQETKRQWMQGIHLNRQLMWEALFIKWVRYAVG